MIKMVLFDLDGTLLPMEQDVFIKAYFGGVAKRLAQYGLRSRKSRYESVPAHRLHYQ